MAWDDKFNEGYNKAFPDTTQLVTWKEPIEGSRRRWKTNRFYVVGGAFFMFVIGGSFALMKAPMDSGGLHVPWSLMAVPLVVSAIMVIRFRSRMTIAIFSSSLTMSSGGRRGYDRVLYTSMTLVRLAEIDGFSVLTFTSAGEVSELYLDPLKKNQIIACLAKLNVLPNDAAGGSKER